MWLTRLRLGKFGAFQDWPLEGLTPGLNLLYGPNESGKTTLMMFLRAMFFGFPARGKTLYDPLDGSEPGGHLHLADSRGQAWVVERWGRGRSARVTVSGPAGADRGEAALRDLLQNLSREVYENIFAFGLKELSEIATLNQREVQHLLYSASMGLGGVSLKAVEDGLERQIGDLYKPRGAREINQILTHLGETRATIGALENQPQEYQDLKAALGAIAGEILELTREREVAAREARWLETLRQGWDVWQELGQSQAQLAGLPPSEPFPEDGLKRWEAARASLAEVEGELERWSGQLERLRPEGIGPVNRPLLEVAEAIADLWDERVLFREKTEDLKQRQAAVAAASSRLAESRAALGPSWDEARLEAFSPALNWPSALQQWTQRLDAAAAPVRQAEDRSQRWAEKLGEQEAARDQAAASGPFSAGKVLLWSFGALGLLLALAGAAVWVFLGKPFLALGLGAVAGMAGLADLAYLAHMRLTHGRRLRELAAEIEHTLGACRAAADALELTRRSSQELQAEWRAFLATWSLDPELTPFAAMEMLREAAKARGQLQELRQAQGAVAALEEYLEGYAARLARVLAPLGQPPAARDEINRTLEHLKSQLAESIMNQEAHTQRAQKLAETETQREIWQAKAERWHREMSRLLAAAGAGDEEDFRRRASLSRQRQDLAQDISRLAAQLQLLAGGPEALARLKADLGRTSRDDLEEQLGGGRARLQELENRLAQAQQDQGKTRDRLEGLERADDLSRALLTEQTLAARLHQAAHRWAVAVLSRHFLELGRRRFEAEYQPQVLQRASAYFELMTGGRYQRVMATLEGEKLLVVNRLGSHVGVEHLSRGAQEQLYLAMRCALVQEYSQGGRNLPLLLDDILVNFDARRARQAVQLLKEMSRSHQLLLFTCHPHLVALVQETLGPEAPAPIALEGNS